LSNCFKKEHEKRIIRRSYCRYIIEYFLLFFVIIACFSEASYDAGDGIQHYLVARYSWLHPFLFLDSWGKPFYTLICSSFAQFGLIGAVFFNILCGIGAAFYAYKICKKIELDYAWMAIPFVLFAPGYFPTLNSGLTEPFFSLILMACIYGFLCGWFTLSSILISFLPFIRTEGFLIIPLFFTILIYRRKFYHVFLLGCTTLLYSIIGKFFLGDLFGIINHNPYNGVNAEFYGHGEWFHFIANYNYLFGTLLIVFFLLGIYSTVNEIVKLKQKQISISNTLYTEQIILIIGAFAVYLFAHSLMWYKGWANSLGMLRVIAAVLPLTAIIMLRGFNLCVPNKIKKKLFLKRTIIIVVLYFVIVCPFKKDYFPFKFSVEQSVINRAADWLKASKYYNHKIYILDPFAAQLLDLDIYNSLKSERLWYLYQTIKEQGIDAVPDSTIVFWDSHFGPNECRISLNQLLEDTRFKHIKSFRPKERFTTLGEHEYELNIFMKLPKPQSMVNLKQIRINFEGKDVNVLNGILDSSLYDTKNKYMKKINSDNEFANSYTIPVNNIPYNTLQCRIKANIHNPNKDSLKFIAVTSVSSKSKINYF
jgi:hypothetical protein